MNVSLTKRLEKMVADLVKDGRYGSASEVVRESLRLMLERDAEREARFDRLRKHVQEGFDSSKRGGWHVVDRALVEGIKREGRRRLAETRGAGGKRVKPTTLSDGAREDLVDIWLYVAQRNPAAADRLVERITSTCERIEKMPRMGRPRPKFGKGMRSFTVGEYLVFYRVVENSIRVGRILHGHRDLAPLLEEPM